MAETKPTVHELNTWPEYLNAIMGGRKRFEVRVNDRNFKIGDRLLLREYIRPERKSLKLRHDGYFTQRWARCEITYIMPGGQFGLQEGWCVLSIKLLSCNPEDV
jgi:ASC-1-like (ASCH) protein